MSTQELKALIAIEERALNSLIAFREEFIPSQGDSKPAAFHELWSDILLRGKGNFAIEAFRESAKTQIVIRANLLHALTFPQEKRSYLVIICATQTTASKKLQEVSREFFASPKMQGLVQSVNDNSGLALEVVYRSGQKVRIEAYGKGAAVRGLSWGSKRPDLVIIDDPQDEEDARSETVTANDWDWFLSDVFFLGQSTRIFMIGNNLGERCIIERVIKGAKQLNFTTQRIPILNDEGQSAWPDKWPIEAIEKDREEWEALGKTDIWYRNKMCECISPDSQKFKREYFRYYDRPPSPSEMNIYTTVDLAISQKVNADCTAIVTVGVNSEGHWFVLDIEYGRYNPSTQIDAIFSAVQKWRPLAVGIEVVAYQAALQHFLEQEMPRRGIFFRIQPLKAEKKKEIRIDNIQPRFAVGSVWFKSQAAWLPKIEGELLAYPHGSHDDVIDALAYIEQMAVSPFIYGSKLGEIGGIIEDWNPIAGKM
ncbi:MAG: phage terminase large subunit [Synergistaceae bacterium]|nr:phage terminase large subunit [Synergistaceae bacterium]